MMRNHYLFSNTATAALGAAVAVFFMVVRVR
jgi:hypothetical protein